MTQNDKELIIEWFEHIAQIADDRKTANGVVMKDWAALDEIKAIAKDSIYYIGNHTGIWHSLDEKPIFPKSDDELLCSILVLYDNGNMFLYRYGKNGIPNDITTPHFWSIMNAKWCYCNDLIP